MMSRGRLAGTEPPAKRAKLDGKGGYKFTSADEIRKSLKTQDQDSLTQALTALRNQLSVKSNEIISPQDERLLLAQHWMDLAPGAQDMFEAWEGANQRQMTLSALFVSVVASLLVLLSSHYTYQVLGQPIITTLVSPPWMRRLMSNLGGSHNELVLVTLKLLNAMSSFAGGLGRKSLSEAFAWETKSLPKLLFMRRKSKIDAYTDSIARPDIRTLYVQFVLSFVDPETSAIVKQAFLEQHRDVFLSLFKGIAQDPYPVIRKVLEVCWAGIWSDPKIKRTLKVGLFNETTIFQLVKLYDRVAPENSEAEQVPADLVHHFLLAICTRPGVGICFKDRGWYPRESDGDDRAGHADDQYMAHKTGRIYNKILANLLKTLKVNEDSRQQELAIKIMTACPELVTSYWAGAALTLEPRLSSKWIGNISFFGSVISLPVPSSSFLLPGSDLFQPSPPQLPNIIENILPSVNTKNNMSKGLQSSSSLVQHCTALALAKCLGKYVNVIRAFQHVQKVLEEGEEDGQWSKRRREVEREVRRRVPEFQVIVGFSQQKPVETTVQATDIPPTNSMKLTLISESAQRLLWLYHRCLPSLVAEARFDVGKLLHVSLRRTARSINDLPEEHLDVAIGLHTVRELHVLRLLKESDQFSWSGKSPSSSYSYLRMLLKAYNTTEVPATRLTITSLLKVVLSDSILFQEDPQEVYLWLDSLPATQRTVGAEALDGAMLTDEGDSVIDFLDDCVQRCLKTPHRYLEGRDSLAQSISTESAGSDESIALDHQAVLCSPLLVVVLDQLGAKIAGKLLTPSDVLALATFVRKLVFKLSSKQRALDFLLAWTDRFDALLRPDLFPEYPNIMTAIRREVPILRLYLGHTHVSTSSPAPSSVVQEFLTNVEQVEIPESVVSRAASAFELSDWARLTGHPLHTSEIIRLASTINRLYPPAMREFLCNLGPGQGSVWDIESVSLSAVHSLSFDSLFICATPAVFANTEKRDLLIEVLFSPPAMLIEVQRAIHLIGHSLVSLWDQHSLQKHLLLLMTSIFQKAQTILSSVDLVDVKHSIFMGSPAVGQLCMSASLNSIVQEGLNILVDTCLDTTLEDDRKVAANFSLFWANTLKASLISKTDIQVALVIPWIKYLESEDLFSLLNEICNGIANAPSGALQLLEAVMTALKQSTTVHLETLGKYLGHLLALRSYLPHSVPLDAMIAMAVNNGLPMAHDGSLFFTEGAHLGTMTALAETRWKHRASPLLADIDCQIFLTQDGWTEVRGQIVSNLLFVHLASRKIYFDWLAANGHTLSLRILATTLSAYLDGAIRQGDAIQDTENDVLISQCSRILSGDMLDPSKSSPDLASVCGRCIYLAVDRLRLEPTSIMSLFHSHVQSIRSSEIGTEAIMLGRRISKVLGPAAGDTVTSLVDRSMQTIVRLLSSDSDTFDQRPIIDEIAHLLECVTQVKTHLAEPVIAVVIQGHLSNIAALNLLSVLVQRASLKPVSVNRYLQTVVQSPSFYKISVASTATRYPLVDLLYVLFHLHPNNTCQPSHLEPLVRIYGGTMSKSDRQLLAIFQLFETHRKTSVASILIRWSSSSDASSTPFEAMQSLDPIRVLRTCLAYPTRRSFTEDEDKEERRSDAQIYDPIFVMLLLAHTLSLSPPSLALHWVQLFRTNAVSLLIRSLSAKDNDIRSAALCQLASLSRCLETADMQEKPHVLYILKQLKDTLPPPSDGYVHRLPSYSTLVLLHSLRGVFYPTNFIYPLTARFLLQRPELDTSDVPMLYSMLYNSTDDWKKERAWIIRFLADGMTSTEDWRVFKRRHTWELLSSLFQTSEADQALRIGILDVLANITCITQAATSLVLKSSLLTWIEMQLKSAVAGEHIAWVKILENILHATDAAKLEAAIGGDWRSAFCRCLSLLLPDESATTTAVFPHVVAITLQLSLLSNTPDVHFTSLVDRLLQVLLSFEGRIQIPTSYRRISRPSQSKNSMLHGSLGLHEPMHNDDDLVHVWGKGVEALWRVTMTFNEKLSNWDALTCRFLLWRAIVGEDASQVGEWARREVIRGL